MFDELDRAVQAILSGSPPSAVTAELEPLLAVAADLRDLPDPSFRTRLKGDLMPAEQTLTPYIIVKEAEALIDFVKRAFGAEELVRGTGSAGGIHCTVRIGDSNLNLGGGGQWRGTPMPGSLHVYVPDVDALYQRVLDAGAVSLMPPTDQVYGDRDSALQDPFGNHWYIGTARGPSYRPAGLRTVTPYLHPYGAAQLVDFIVAAFGADVLERHASEDGIVRHGKVRIEGSMLEMGEGSEKFPPMPMAIILTVTDADAGYARAMNAGATSLWLPANQPYGVRVGGVEDPFGNRWYISGPLTPSSPSALKST